MARAKTDPQKPPQDRLDREKLRTVVVVGFATLAVVSAVVLVCSVCCVSLLDLLSHISVRVLLLESSLVIFEN